MKSRVLAELDRISDPAKKPSDMAPILQNELKIENAELQIRAKNALRHMLHHYSDISISTIDHFTHGLIRSFAQDLDLSVNFEVELDTDKISNEVVRGLLSKVGTDKVLTRALINVLEQQMDGEKNWSIVQTLSKFSKTLFTEESRFHLEKLKHLDLNEYNEIRSALNERVSALKLEMTTAASNALSALNNAGIAQEKMFQGGRGVHGFYTKCSKGDFDSPNSYVLKSLEEDKWASSKADSNDKAAIESIKPILVSAIESVIENYPTLKYLSLVYDNLYGVALLEEMLAIQKQLQEEEELLHIGEFNHLVSKVVMSETAPFIYERIGHRFKHFLVDEFQDTSVLQWFNLLPLIDESLANNNLCLVVGDAKQSIYRWRGGDVQQFVKLPQVYTTEYLQESLEQNPELKRVMHEREAALQKSDTEEPPLMDNYRSARNVVSFNNELFEELRDGMAPDHQTMYHNASQNIKKEKEGLVEIRFLEKQTKGNKRWEEYDPITLKQVEDWINEAKEDGFLLGDIAIILRTNKDAVKIAQYLVERNVKVVSNESLLINSSAAVKLMFNIAVWLIEPEDTVNQVELVQNIGIFRKEEEHTPARLLQAGDNKKSGILILLAELYADSDWNRLKRLSLFGLFEHLKFMLLKTESDTYVSFFLDEVLNYSRNNSDGIVGFIEFWKEKRHKLSIALPEKDDAVRILTIHKSKGLEFPVVIHPYVDYPTTNFGNDVWAYLNDDQFAPLDRIRVKTGKSLEGTPFEHLQHEEKELKQLDMFNELYVAFTRPKFRLYACGLISQSGSTSSAIQHVYNCLAAKYPSVEESHCYQLGVRSKHSEDRKKQETLELNISGDPNWMSRISIARPSKDKWKTQDESDARNMGILIHEAMARITTSKDIQKAVAMLLQDGRISNSEADEMKLKIEHLLQQKELKALYTDSYVVRNEAAIQLAGGTWLRPDRVAFKDDEAWVLDYKTGKEEARHLKQIDQYKEAMRQLGFKHVRGILVYLNEERFVTV